MFLWRGRNVWWNDHEVIVLEKINKERVKIAYKYNSSIVRIVKRKDISK